MHNFLSSRKIEGKGKNIVGLQRQGNVGGQTVLCLLGGGPLLSNFSCESPSLQHSMLGMRGCTAPGWVETWNSLCHRDWSCPRSTAQPPNPVWVGVCSYSCIINVCYFTMSCIRFLWSLLKSLLLGYFLPLQTQVIFFPCKGECGESIQFLSKVTKQEELGRTSKQISKQMGGKNEREREKKKRNSKRSCTSLIPQFLKPPHLLSFQIWFTGGCVRLTIWQLSC